MEQTVAGPCRQFSALSSGGWVEGQQDHFGVWPHAALGSSSLSGATNGHIISPLCSPRSAPPSESKSTVDLQVLQPSLPLPTMDKRPGGGLLEESRAPPCPYRLFRWAPWPKGQYVEHHQQDTNTLPRSPPPQPRDIGSMCPIQCRNAWPWRSGLVPAPEK